MIRARVAKGRARRDRSIAARLSSAVRYSGWQLGTGRAGDQPIRKDEIDDDVLRAEQTAGRGGVFVAAAWRGKAGQSEGFTW